MFYQVKCQKKNQKDKLFKKNKKIKDQEEINYIKDLRMQERDKKLKDFDALKSECSKYGKIIQSLRKRRERWKLNNDRKLRRK